MLSNISHESFNIIMSIMCIYTSINNLITRYNAPIATSYNRSMRARIGAWLAYEFFTFHQTYHNPPRKLSATVKEVKKDARQKSCAMDVTRTRLRAFRRRTEFANFMLTNRISSDKGERGTRLNRFSLRSVVLFNVSDGKEVSRYARVMNSWKGASVYSRA